MPPQKNTPASPISFDWLIYADATLAGLAALIPLISLDWLVEEFFRRRIPGQIAKYRGQRLPVEVRRALNRNYRGGCAKSCLLLPLTAGYWLFKKLSRKILYFLSVKEASDNVSYYWHLAYLTDYALAAGHLTTPESARIARESMEQVIRATMHSPLYQLATEVVRNTHHVLRISYKFLRGKDSNILGHLIELMASEWSQFDTYFKTVGALYLQTYQAALRQQALAAPPPPSPEQP